MRRQTAKWPQWHWPVGIISRLRSNLQQIVVYSGVQGLIQVANAVTGFLLVRSLSTADYAWFTVGTAAMATVNILADLGLGSVLSSVGGRICNDVSRFSRLVTTVRERRRTFLLLATVITGPLTFWALCRNEASAQLSAAILLFVFLSAMMATEAAVWLNAAKLRRQTKIFVQAEATFSMSRLALTSLISYASPTALLASAATSIAYCLQLRFLRQENKECIENSEPSDEWASEIRTIVRNTAPLGIFSCVQGQLSIFILSFFASAQAVAGLGALTRLSIIFVCLGLPLGHFIFPAFARCESTKRLVTVLLATYSTFLCLTVAIFTFGYFFPELLLMFLGDKYAHLTAELVLFLAGTTVAFIANMSWGLVFARGWVRHAWLSIPITLSLQILLAPMLDFTEIRSVILFSAAAQIGSLMVAVGLIFRGLRTHSDSAMATD
ncbi:MAG: hypothetical protein P8J37_13455 [Fuerstiella sp.]|nr:hypothetical protein [Fuerstiella sp.]